MVKLKCRCQFCRKQRTVEIAESNLNYTLGDPANREKFAYLSDDERTLLYRKVCMDCYSLRWGSTEMVTNTLLRQLDEAKKEIKILKEKLKSKLTTK